MHIVRNDQRFLPLMGLTLPAPPTLHILPISTFLRGKQGGDSEGGCCATSSQPQSLPQPQGAEKCRWSSAQPHPHRSEVTLSISPLSTHMHFVALPSLESNRHLLVEAGGIDVFVQLLESGDEDVQFYSAASLSNLAVHGTLMCACACMCRGMFHLRLSVYQNLTERPSCHQREGERCPV